MARNRSHSAALRLIAEELKQLETAKNKPNLEQSYVDSYSDKITKLTEQRTVLKRDYEANKLKALEVQVEATLSELKLEDIRKRLIAPPIKKTLVSLKNISENYKLPKKKKTVAKRKSLGDKYFE